jgi:acyl dehydratase
MTAELTVSDQVEALVGRTYRMPGYYEVGREKIREFAGAVHDDHPAHHLEEGAAELGYRTLIAPITFTSILGSIVQQHLFTEFVTVYDLSQVLHTDQRIVVHRPVRVGDQLYCESTLESFRESHGQDVLVFRNEITDGDGGAVQTSWTTMIARSGGVIDEALAVLVADVTRRRAPRRH